MNKDLLGYVVDVVAIIAFTVLGALQVLPAGLVMSGLLTILVGRIRPPSPPSAPGGAVVTSGLVTAVTILGLLLFRIVRKA